MEEVLRAKFKDTALQNLLRKTKGFKLIEGNLWHDNHWGSCTCKKRRVCQLPGKNILGILLMKIRDEE